MREGKYVPVDPVVLSGDVYPPNVPDRVVVSALRGSNRELLEEVALLWMKEDDVVIDVTYGKGAFWGNPPEGQVPHIRHDIARDGVDCRALPEDDGSVDVLVFDPPYRPNHGGGGLYGDSYRLSESGLESMNDVIALYEGGIREAWRVLKPGGRIFVKCQDMTYTSRLHLVHLDITRQLSRAGFTFADMFVLVNTSRGSSGSNSTEAAPRRQKKARRSHSYLLIGVKPETDERADLSIDKLIDKHGLRAIERAVGRHLPGTLEE